MEDWQVYLVVSSEYTTPATFSTWDRNVRGAEKGRGTTQLVPTDQREPSEMAEEA